MGSDNTTFTIVLGAIILLSLYYLFGCGPIHNDGTLQTKNNNNVNTTNNVDDNSSDESESISQDLASNDSNDTNNTNNADDSVDSSLEIIKERSMGYNGPYFRRVSGGKYKENSYRTLGTEKSFDNIDKNFKVNDVTKNYTDRFEPVTDGDIGGAPINVGNNKGAEKDKYNVNSFLPQEKEKDWFETIETVDVKNSHLINIYRPIGANTIGNTHKNSTYDLRGTDKAVCPKFVVSPWLQSSYEPDRSMKSLCA